MSSYLLRQQEEQMFKDGLLELAKGHAKASCSLLKRRRIAAKPHIPDIWDQFKAVNFTVLRDSKGKVMPYYTGRNIYQCWMNRQDRSRLVDFMNDNVANQGLDSDIMYAFENIMMKYNE